MKADQHFPIDAVVTWVDGNDPVLNAKRAIYVRPEEAGAKDIAAPTRYANRGEIHWCIRSINKFNKLSKNFFCIIYVHCTICQSQLRVCQDLVQHL